MEQKRENEELDLQEEQDVSQKEEKQFPSVEEIQQELDHEQYKRRTHRIIRSTLFSLLIVAAVTVIMAVIVMPVLQIVGSSMAPTLRNGEIVLVVNGSKYKKGDVIAFYYNNDVLIKRVVAVPGDYVQIDEVGNLFVNGERLEEPYVQDKQAGQHDIEYPYQVPENRVFVLGDNRSVSVDSRNTAIGCISEDMVIGRLFIRVWPLGRFKIFIHGR